MIFSKPVTLRSILFLLFFFSFLFYSMLLLFSVGYYSYNQEKENLFNNIRNSARAFLSNYETEILLSDKTALSIVLEKYVKGNHLICSATLSTKNLLIEFPGNCGCENSIVMPILTFEDMEPFDLYFCDNPAIAPVKAGELRITPELSHLSRTGLNVVLLSFLWFLLFSVISYFVINSILQRFLIRHLDQFSRLLDRPSREQKPQIHTEFHDIFDQFLKKVEALEKANEEISQKEKLASLSTMAGGIAHEINNKLTPILGYASLLAKETDPQLVDEYAQIIRLSALSAKDIVSTMLEFTRSVKETKMDFIDLAKFIPLFSKMFCHPYKSSSRKCPLRYSITADSELIIKSNETHLDQILLNLLKNSLDAAAEKGIDPALKIDVTAAESKVFIKVSDNGPGIPDSIRNRIFDPFFTTKPVGKGTGLGLSIVYTLLQRQNASISLSQTDTGTEFVIAFDRVTEKGIIITEKKTDISKLSLHKKGMILVIDDNLENRGLISHIITRNGFSAVCCEHLNDARPFFNQNPVLIICNQNLSNLKGLEIYSIIKEHYSHLRSCFTVLTGSVTEKELDFISCEKIPLLMKPFTEIEMINFIISSLPEKDALS